jgi:hypothetical protein
MAVRVKPSDVVDRYEQVVPGAAHLADPYLQTIEGSIAKQQLPVHVSRQDVAAKFFGGIRGTAREFLVLVPENPAHRTFAAFHFGFPIGVNLAVGWYVTEEGRGMKIIAGAIHPFSAAAAGLSDMATKMDLFDVADLIAILASVHQFAVMEALYAIASQVGFDHDRIGRRSVGMFGIG